VFIDTYLYVCVELLKFNTVLNKLKGFCLKIYCFAEFFSIIIYLQRHFRADNRFGCRLVNVIFIDFCFQLQPLCGFSVKDLSTAVIIQLHYLRRRMKRLLLCRYLQVLLLQHTSLRRDLLLLLWQGLR